ncbi:MAG: serine hydrolase [Alphaproteobacteria bacterium]
MAATRRTIFPSARARIAAARIAGTLRAAALAGLIAAAGAPADARAAQYASIVMDAATGEVLESVNADVQTYPASLAKMMTLYLAFEALDAGTLTLDRLLPVSSHAAAQRPSKLGLRPGEMIRVADAIRALTVRSANDVAVVLAEALGGTEYSFGRMMTAKARELGMHNTVFRNASGLPDNAQVTTAYDMALLSRAVIFDHPRHYHYFSAERFEHRGRVHESHNRLVRFYPGADGIKTGYIRASGFNLAASAERDGRRLIAVVMGGENAGARDRHTADLLDRGFEWAVARGPRPAAAPPRDVASAAVPGRSSPAAFPSPAAPSADPHSTAEGAEETSRSLIPAGRSAASPARVQAAAGGWSIQVGVFSNPSNAQRIAAEAAGLLPRLPADAKPGVFSMVARDGRTLYRARVVGVTRDAALAACATLERHKRDCLAVES